MVTKLQKNPSMNRIFYCGLKILSQNSEQGKFRFRKFNVTDVDTLLNQKYWEIES
jgi:hypothetical protein